MRSRPGSKLPEVVALHNIDDIESVIKHCMKKSGLTLKDEQYDELFYQGVVLIYEMAEKYQPRDEGSSFYGFVMTFLPRKLGGAWHQMNETHVLVTHPGGKRSWRYYKDPRSLSEPVHQEDDLSTDLAETLDDARCPGNFIAPPVAVPS